jgi:hypothetical protein
VRNNLDDSEKKSSNSDEILNQLQPMQQVVEGQAQIVPFLQSSTPT